MDEKMTKTSEISDSAEMMSNHTMKLICYEINLGTVRGQKIHALHLIFLPLLPILILLVQNYTTFDYNKVKNLWVRINRFLMWKGLLGSQIPFRRSFVLNQTLLSLSKIFRPMRCDKRSADPQIFRHT